MDRKIIKWLKVIAIICVIILFIELSYIIYCAFFRTNDVFYFDGINAFYPVDNSYVAVGSNNNNEKSLEKAKLTKYGNKKEVVFEKIYNKGFNGAFFGITVDNEDYIAVGSYEANEKEHNNSLRSALIVKYDKDGNILFEKDLQVLGSSKFTDVLVVEDGYIVSGQSIYENMTLGFSKAGGAFLVKYSKDGKEVWRKNYGGNKSAIYNDLVEVDGNIYAVGKDSLNVGIISKYDMDGNHIKTTEYKYTDSLGFTDVLFVDGFFYISTSKDKSDNESDAMIVKYDLDLQYVNEVTYGGKGIERFNRIIKDNNDNLVVIGTKASVNKDKNGDVKVSNYDGIIGKYDLDLEKVAVISYGNEKDDYFTDIKLDTKDGYVVSGYSSYEDGSYLSKFINYSDALKVLEVE